MKLLSVCGLTHRSGNYLIVQRAAGGSQGLKWEFPGGKVEANETPAQAVVREWQEELGLNVKASGLRFSSMFSNGEKTYELQAWSVELGTQEPALREHVNASWLKPEELIRLDLSDSDRAIAELLLTQG